MSASASTSAKPGAVKLTATESKFNKIGLAAPNKTITLPDLLKEAKASATPATMEAINSLLRKNLCTLLQSTSGILSYRFRDKDEAKAMGSMDSDEKLVLDQITDAGNMGIWTKDLTKRTGLLPTTVTKCLKALEQRKAVKTVKSVKYPTRKIYMLATITPSVDITGGPWFTDNELDTEFVGELKRITTKFLSEKSAPKDPTLLYMTAVTPTLPTVSDVRKFVSKVVMSVELSDEHIESLLDLMVHEGTVEKVMVMNLRRGGGGDLEGSGGGGGGKGKGKKVGVGKKRGKKGAVKGGGGKRRKIHHIDDSGSGEESKSESDFDSDDEGGAKVGGGGGNKRRKKRRPVVKKSTRGESGPKKEEDEDEDVKALASDAESASSSSSSSSSSGEESDDDDDDDNARGKKKGGYGDDSTSINDYVYRIRRPYVPTIGWTDMPCGRCPVEAFCSESSFARSASGSAKAGTAGAKVSSLGLKSGKPRVGEMQGVGMMGGAGAAIGASGERWGEVGGSVGHGVDPVNPRDCHYFAEWLVW